MSRLCLPCADGDHHFHTPGHGCSLIQCGCQSSARFDDGCPTVFSDDGCTPEHSPAQNPLCVHAKAASDA